MAKSKIIKAKKVKPGTRAKGEPPRTARIRYVEPPSKKDGNPFFALRVPSALLRGFKSYAKKKDTTTTQLVRDYMSKCTGIEVESEGEP